MLGASLAAGPGAAGAQSSGGASGATIATIATGPNASPPPTATPDAPGIVVASVHYDLADPFIMAERGKYYLFSSTAFGDPHHYAIPELVGKPGHWKEINALKASPPWAVSTHAPGASQWAPTVHKFGKTYVMYYAVGSPTPPLGQHCLALATSKSPAGPYKSLPKQFICQKNYGGDIDAEVFVDPGGPNGAAHPYYLVWKSDNNSTPGDGIPTIWSAGLSNNGLRLTSSPVQIYQPTEPWQEKLIESPEMIMGQNGQIYLFYSAGGGYTSSTYAMGYASCVSPLGPCSDPTNGPFLASNAQGTGPGEETLYIASDGSVWLVYDPWYAGITYAWFRPAEAIRLGFDAQGPYIGDPGSFPAPSGRR